MKNNKRGIIKVTQAFLDEMPRSVIEIFAFIGFLPLFIDHGVRFDSLDYMGICEGFRDLQEGEIYPVYIIHYHVNTNGDIDGARLEEVNHSLAIPVTRGKKL